MAKVIFSLLTSLLFFAGSATAQFKMVPYGSGVALSTASSGISGSYSIAGGGVILRGNAQCNGNCDIIGVQIVTSSNTAYIALDNKQCKAKYTAPQWMVKDAIALVDSETSEVYRNVNLLGYPTTKKEIKYSSDDYWHVEISDALIKRKSGELLLAIDLMLTDPGFYSNFNIDRKHDTVGEKKTKKQENISDEENISPNDNVIAFENARNNLINTVNWTWNDEKTKYSYNISCNKKTINITGNPTYTFLLINDNGELAEDMDATKYFTKNDSLIFNLNQNVYEKGIQFARLSAMLRNFKETFPNLWNKLVDESKALPESHGSTPRIISR